MNSIIIRQATAQDAPSIMPLMIELGYSLELSELESRIEIYSGPNDIVLVADEGGEVIGFVSFHMIPLFHAPGNLGRITAMSISAQHQRKGIGKALLEKLEDHALNRGCVRIEVTSGDHRKDDAHIFYLSCGYAKDSRRFQKMLSKENQH